MNQQNKYPLVSSLGLDTYDHLTNYQKFIYASDLEAILQKAVVVYSTGSGIYSPDKEKNDTHTALLINIQPIKEKTTLEKISEILEKFRETNNNLYLADQIKKLIEAENETSNNK